MLTLGALVIAIGCVLAARSLFAGGAAPQADAAVVPTGPKVLVAQRALPVGTIITADAIKFQQWPKEMVQDAYFIDGEADMNKLLGTVVRYPITAGQPVTQGALVAPGDRGFLAAALGPGMRAVTIPVSEKTGVGGFVFPGDHVDLVLTQSVASTDGGEGLKASETIIQNLRVLATDTSTETETVDGKTVVHGFRNVTVEVTPRLAEKIAVAQTIGTLSLSLRSLSDSQSDLDHAIASGAIKVPAGASKDQEDQLLKEAEGTPVASKSSFVTGGDVSRFQRTSMPLTRPVAPAAPSFNPMMMRGGPGGMPSFRPAGPMVRVTRGKITSEQSVPLN